MDIDATCSQQYSATRRSGTRDPQSVRWIVLHSTEGATAKGAAAFFASANATGSAHLVVDDDICYRTLANNVIPWGASSSFGANQYGFHIEQAGFANWTKAKWLTHQRTIQRAAYKTALHCLQLNVPVQWVSAAQLPGRNGITTHDAVSDASRRLDPENAGAYGHWDPGSGWPQAEFMAYVRGYYDSLTPGPSASGQVLSHQELEQLWVDQGGNPAYADIAAAIAEAESGGRVDALNDNPATGDYSVGLWQINYYGSLRGPRTAAYGTPDELRKSAAKNAKAAISISGNGTNFNPWTTYTSGAYRQYLTGGGTADDPAAEPPRGGQTGKPGTRAPRAMNQLLRQITRDAPNQIHRSSRARTRLARLRK